jgi:hypothetical protein
MKPYVAAVVTSSGVDGNMFVLGDSRNTDVIILMVRGNLALVIVFFKGLSSMKRYTC